MQPTHNKQTEKEQTEGSPTTKPCTNSEMSGTAKEQSAAAHINTTDTVAAPTTAAPSAPEDTSIRAGPVPLYLIPQTISSEIHTHGGDISVITVRRTGQHVYAITLTKTDRQTQKQRQNQKQKQETVQGKGPGTKQTGTTRPKPGQKTGDAGEPHAV